MPFKSDNNEQMPPESQYKSYIQEGLSNRRIITRNVLLINDQNNDRILTERAPVSIDQQDNVFFRDLIVYLREQNLIQPGSSLFFYDEQRKVFVHQGTEPVTSNTMIPLLKFDTDQIIIKYRPIQHSYLHPSCESSNNLQYIMAQQQRQQQQQQKQYPPPNIAQNKANQEMLFSNKQMQIFQSNAYGDSSNKNNNNNNNNVSCSHTCNSQSSGQNSNNSCNQQHIMNMTKLEEEEDINYDVTTKTIPREKRVKERKIGYVYERVLEWRRYYESGFQNELGRLIKVNLDVAANMVGLSRKTLDDYYKYIRKAESFRFDFKVRSDEKIGVLRNFVRDRQKHQSKIEEDDNQVDVDHQNREGQSGHEDANIKGTSINNTNLSKQSDDDEDNNESPRKQIKTESVTQCSHIPSPPNQDNNQHAKRSHLLPPPPYTKEEENLYNKNYMLQNQKDKAQLESKMRIGQTLNQGSLISDSNMIEREGISTGTKENVNLFNHQTCHNVKFEQEEKERVGVDTSSQTTEQQCMEQSNQNTYFEKYLNKLDNYNLQLNKQVSIPLMQFGSFNCDNLNIKQEIGDDRFIDVNCTSPNQQDDQDCNFLNDNDDQPAMQMQSSLQEY